MPVQGTVPLGLGNPGRPRRRGRAPLAVTSSAERRAAPCPGRTRPARPGEDAAAAGRRPPGGPSSATACVDAPRRGAGLSAAGTARAGPCRGPVPLPGTAAPLGQAGAPLRKRAPTLTLGGDRVDGAAPSPPGPVSVRCWASWMPPAGQRAAGHSTPPRPELDLVVVASILLIQGLSKPRGSRLCRGPECRAGVCHLCWAREGTAVDVPRGLGGHRAAPEPAARSSPRSHVPLTSGPRTRLRADATPEGPRLVTERSRRRVNDRWREGRVPLP